MSDVPVAAAVMIYAVAGCVFFGLLYLVVRAAVRAALRTVVLEMRSQGAARQQPLEQIATSAAFLADVADAWADAEADRRGCPSRQLRRAPAAGGPVAEASTAG